MKNKTQKAAVKLAPKAAKTKAIVLKFRAGKTTRATVIGLLVKNVGKTVSISALTSAVSKVTGNSPERSKLFIGKRTPKIKIWATTHNYNLIANSAGMKLAPKSVQ